MFIARRLEPYDIAAVSDRGNLWVLAITLVDPIFRELLTEAFHLSILFFGFNLAKRCSRIGQMAVNQALGASTSHIPRQQLNTVEGLGTEG